MENMKCGEVGRSRGLPRVTYDRVTYDRYRAQSGCETGSPSGKKDGGPAMGRAIGE